jgi:hypothetical protein
MGAPIVGRADYRGGCAKASVRLRVGRFRAWTNGVQVDRMEDMEKLEVRTQSSLYEIIIIEGHSGETQALGLRFPQLLTIWNSKR